MNNLTTLPARIKIGENNFAHSAAQAQTLIAYGDLYDLPFRNLSFKVECEDFKDFAACLRIIKQYNEFNSAKILQKATELMDIKRYWNEKNPNNGRNMYSFEIARESSPAFYIKFNDFLKPKSIADGEIFEHTGEIFERNMKMIKEFIEPDEFELEKNNFYNESTYYTARFWYD